MELRKTQVATLEIAPDRRRDPKVRREMSQDATEDPAVKIAAQRARSLTIEQYRTLR